MTILTFPRVPRTDPDPDDDPVSQAIGVDVSFEDPGTIAQPRSLSTWIRDTQMQSTTAEAPCIACGAPSPSHDPGCVVEHHTRPIRSACGD